MSYVLHVTMTEEEEAQSKAKTQAKVHVDGKYEYKNLETAREAAEVACHAAAKLKPSRSKTTIGPDIPIAATRISMLPPFAATKSGRGHWRACRRIWVEENGR